MEIYEEIRQDREKGARRLVAEYRTRLQAAAQMLTGDPHEAEDLVFRSFERAIMKIDEFRPTGSFYYWIYTILLNFRRMDARKKAVRPLFLPHDELPDVPDGRSDILGRLDFAASSDAVRQAVRALPENFREVVVLRYFEDMSTPEIAKVTGLNEGTVRSRLHYAKDALYSMLCDTELSPDFADRLVRATVPPKRRRWWVASCVVLLGLAVVAAGTGAALKALQAPGEGVKSVGSGAVVQSVFQTGKWKMAAAEAVANEDAVDAAIENGLKYIASQQREDGTFPGSYGDSAAVPALAGMAFLSKGHMPGSEPYGEMLLKCLDCVLRTPDLRDNAPFRGYMGAKANGNMYAHSIATLFIAEMSGMVDDSRQAKIDEVLPLAAKVILDAQNQSKAAQHLGGWRYQPNSSDSDLSCSGWALMALRSARLNGAKVPDDAIEKAVLYVKRSQSESSGAFSYQGNGGSNGETLTGAGILCLELCGKHLDPVSLKAAKFLSNSYQRSLGSNPYYGLYYASQGLFQLGGPTWKAFESWMYGEFRKKQQPDGSWRGEVSPVYATSMAVLAFTVPYRMLPIYQRDETVDPEEDDEKNPEKKGT